jgi:hypothetical protein
MHSTLPKRRDKKKQKDQLPYAQAGAMKVMAESTAAEHRP